jgi:hypothetical protein
LTIFRTASSVSDNRSINNERPARDADIG